MLVYKEVELYDNESDSCYMSEVEIDLTPNDIADLLSLDRDQFMKELREQFALLKLEWPQ